MKQTRAEARWRSLILAQQRSGSSVREFAAARGISAVTFYWWRRRLRQREGDLVAVQVVDRAMKPAGHGSGFELRIGDAMTLQIPPGFDEAELRRVVQVLRC